MKTVICMLVWILFIGCSSAQVSHFTFKCVDLKDQTNVAKGEVFTDEKYGQYRLVVLYKKNGKHNKYQFFVNDVSPHFGMKITRDGVTSVLKGNKDPMLTFVATYGLLAAYPACLNPKPVVENEVPMFTQPFRCEPTWPVKYSNTGDSKSPFIFAATVDEHGVSNSTLTLKMAGGGGYKVEFKRKLEKDK